MIMSRNDDGTYSQVGFIKDNSGADIEYIKDKDGVILFEKGFTREKSGALPLQLDGIGKPLKDYTIYGNTYQSDGASPDTPQEVVGCGDRTGNLAYDKIETANIGTNGAIMRTSGYDIAIAHVEIGKVYTVDSYVFAFYTDEPVLGSTSYDGSRVVEIMGQHTTFTAPITGYVAFRVNSGERTMLNEGETPLPYEPYGYKIPVECRGKNLFSWDGNLVGSSSLVVSTNEEVISSVVDVRGVNTIYFTGDSTLLNSRVYRISKSDTPIEAGSTIKTYDASFSGGVYDVSDCNYLLITASVYAMPQENREIIKSTFMLNEGNTPEPYEPYTPPITTQIYLDSPLYKIGDYSDSRGMTEEIRAIKELVLTGEEQWQRIDNWFRLLHTDMPYGQPPVLCSHFERKERWRLQNGESGIGTCGSYYGNQMYQGFVVRYDDLFTTEAEFKSYLAAQYANGTPVTVYYVLAEPEVTSVEPLEIPSLNGTTVIEAETTVQPSEMHIKYKSRT